MPITVPAMAPVPRRELLVIEGAADVKVDVGGTADEEDVGPASTPWLQVTAVGCGESSTKNAGLMYTWDLQSEVV